MLSMMLEGMPNSVSVNRVLAKSSSSTTPWKCLRHTMKIPVSVFPNTFRLNNLQ